MNRSKVSKLKTNIDCGKKIALFSFSEMVAITHPNTSKSTFINNKLVFHYSPTLHPRESDLFSLAVTSLR